MDRPTPRWRRVALIVSLVFHAVLLTTLGLWYVNRTHTVGDDVASQVSDASPPDPSPPVNRPEPSPDVSSAQVNNTLERITDAYEEKPTEQQLTALQAKAADLEKLTTEASVEEIAGKFREWTNIQPRESAPAIEPVEGQFDFDTAQIHEVLRSENEAGEVQYTSVLVDAAGRTFEVEMSAEDGEQAFRTMQTLKKYPLAEKVYRSMVMPLIDKAIGEEQMTNDK